MCKYFKILSETYFTVLYTQNTGIRRCILMINELTRQTLLLKYIFLNSVLGVKVMSISNTCYFIYAYLSASYSFKTNDKI